METNKANVIDWGNVTANLCVTNSTITFTKLLPIGDITVYGDKYKYVFKPMEDITNLEICNLLKLYIHGTMGTGAPPGSWVSYDFEGFIMQNGLERHFEKKER